MFNEVMNYKKLKNDKNLNAAEKVVLEYLEKYPESQELKYYYASILNRKGEFEKAFELFDQIKLDAACNTCYEYVKTCIFTDRYEEALRKLDMLENMSKNSKYRMTDEMKKRIEKGYILCLNKIGILNEDYQTPIENLKIYLKQTLNYDAKYVIDYITKAREVNLANGKLTFSPNLSISDLYEEVHEYLVENNPIHVPCTNILDDLYYFTFPGYNSMNDRSVDLLVVATIRGTKDIISMFPASSEMDIKYINSVDFKCVQKSVKKLVKTNSQIEKFNKKYNL